MSKEGITRRDVIVGLAGAGAALGLEKCVPELSREPKEQIIYNPHVEEEQKEFDLTPAQAWFIDSEVEFIGYDPERSQEEPHIARIEGGNSTYKLTVAPIDAQTLNMQGQIDAGQLVVVPERKVVSTKKIYYPDQNVIQPHTKQEEQVWGYAAFPMQEINSFERYIPDRLFQNNIPHGVPRYAFGPTKPKSENEQSKHPLDIVFFPMSLELQAENLRFQDETDENSGWYLFVDQNGDEFGLSEESQNALLEKLKQENISKTDLANTPLNLGGESHFYAVIYFIPVINLSSKTTLYRTKIYQQFYTLTQIDYPYSSENSTIKPEK